MSEHLTDEQIEGYRKRDLQPEQLVAASRHCLSCEACRSRLNETGNLQAAFKNLKQNLQTGARENPDHLEYGLLEAYVDNRADELDREIVESHIELCRDCAAELKELQAFAAMLQNSAVAETKPVEKVSLWRRWFSFGNPALRLAGLAVAVLLIGTTVFFALFRGLNSSPRPIARGNDNQSLPANQNANANEPQQPQNPELAHGNQNAANRNTPAPQPTSVLAFLVPLDISRGGGDERSTLKISPSVGFVDLKVEVQNADGKNFGAQLLKLGGPPQTLKASRAQNGVVSFRVAARGLTSGQNYLKVFATPRDPNRSDIETVFKVERLQK